MNKSVLLEEKQVKTTMNKSVLLEEKQVKTPSKGTLRTFLFINVKDSKNLIPAQIETEIRKRFICKSIIISKKDSDLEGFTFRIGLWTKNGSKHTYRKKTLELFPGASPETVETSAKKGIGTWARLLCEPGYKIHFCSGELQADRLREISKNTSQKVKMERAMPAPQKGKVISDKKKKVISAPQKGKVISDKRKKTSFFIQFQKKMLKGLWRFFSFIVQTVLYRLISFTVWLSASTYTFFYKGAVHLTPEVMQTLTFEQILFWFLDWKTPGLPPEWGATQTDLWASLHIWSFFYQLIDNLFK